MIKWSSENHCPMCGSEDITEIDANKRYFWIPFKKYYYCETCYAEYLIILKKFVYQFERPNTFYLYKDF